MSALKNLAFLGGKEKKTYSVGDNGAVFIDVDMLSSQPSNYETEKYTFILVQNEIGQSNLTTLESVTNWTLQNSANMTPNALRTKK